ncbi:Ricin-type beta-trefoil lectin domain-containing protein [Streptoalloteichus tenebrarius]|uniref:Ricin-type beta-trefoil lectin domain-containing protein n=1 Tax=Streptoalloteichus tenebrarius (strain ATCC 17920 / DSM 40477 / JCM 4838 / CBS 697.72 / NBRC 16177 / NCIMB 11028 / NRRL B-12390 / A12253. 1 / ISP 5477) TaxID=1933 RepID=A0ABT1HWC3_STRSD|nr:ricin-type beta-trefoil lectin domain protein [Streptoalloteichus tenebrarius]MCP2259815.1 Ricin-type beta-trefoil lectin domain-containing protein [Streptoalloteichus tenebrarius]BFE99237.1 hypothetical protein GCM10020241_09130 [Streptoalloteichus tenebrarius]
MTRRFGGVAARAVLAVVTGLLGLAVLGTPASAATAQSNPNVRYTTSFRNAAIHEIRASYTWKCLDIRGESTNPGAVVQTYDCKGKLHQRFAFLPVSNDGLFSIVVFGRYCIGGANGATHDGAPVVTAPCTGPSQFFRWVDRGSNHWEIVEASSGRCLQDNGPRAQVTLRDCPPVQEPYPSLWTAIYDRQFDYGSIWG